MQILIDLARGTNGLFTTSQAHEAGVASSRLTELVRRGAIARLARGVYRVGASIPVLHPAEVAAGLAGALSFLSAAAWWGVDLPRTPRRVHVTVRRNRGVRKNAVKGVRIHRAVVAPSDLRVVRGVLVTSPLRTALDLARHLPLEEAVSVVDAFMRKGLLTRRDFLRAAAGSHGPGRNRILRVAALVDPKSGSILESLTRVLLWRHGLLPPRSQYRFEAVGFRGYLDFAWPEIKVALECDGYEFHSGRESFHKDRRRWSALNRSDWRSGVVTWAEVTGDPDYVVGLVRDLVATAQAKLQHTNATAEAA
jgi:hypothetical protein